MKTCHQVFFADARNLDQLADRSVDLVVTSPPYPMIEMWDGAFALMNPRVEGALADNDGAGAFELIHLELDKIWRECFRVLRPGGIACINIGDAVRTVAGNFQMYSNHARIIQAMSAIGFVQLPDILWRKPTNAPNKFMGSGMLPAGAYVTYEHEYILIFRKGGRRAFRTPEEQRIRRESAFFWEERNLWFSDLWMDLKGTGQELADRSSRERSAAYPFELAYRLICMHSVYGDVVLDPFLGTGTTMAAALASGRNSVGIELDEGLGRAARDVVKEAVAVGRQRASARLAAHRAFIESRREAGKGIKHHSSTYAFPVVTSQEIDLVIYAPKCLEEVVPGKFEAEHEVVPVGSIG
ncbi:MAG: site-specific DNA-methyltransferase [Candidatus Latescibacteria bacterium]|nr:site-specific DNA-methyltransferase [Candidatus Latescibacterota bacterium]